MKRDRRSDAHHMNAIVVLLIVFGLVFGLAVIVIGITVAPDYIRVEHVRVPGIGNDVRSVPVDK